MYGEIDRQIRDKDNAFVLVKVLKIPITYMIRTHTKWTRNMWMYLKKKMDSFKNVFLKGENTIREWIVWRNKGRWLQRDKEIITGE